MKLALDAMGGDNAPQINVDGARLVLTQPVHSDNNIKATQTHGYEINREYVIV